MKVPVSLRIGDPVSSRELKVGDRIIYTGKGIWVPCKVRSIESDGWISVSNGSGWMLLRDLDELWHYVVEVL